MTARDAPSIEELHDAFAGPLFVFAYRQTGDRQTAEEVVQDALLNAWRNADRFDPDRGSTAAWLFTITRNLITDHHRRAAARPRASALLDDRALPEDPSSADVDRAIETWQVAEALACLSEEHRETIVDVHYRGHTVAEAAAHLGIPEGTVKSRLYYGLRAMRLQLEEMGVIG